jgi:hypothetical protein
MSELKFRLTNTLLRLSGVGAPDPVGTGAAPTHKDYLRDDSLLLCQVVLEDRAVVHHKADVLQFCDFFQRIA